MFDLEMTTFFGENLCDEIPTAHDIKLPSQFQIGDAVELNLEKIGIVSAFIYAVRFAGNGTVSYELAVPFKTIGGMLKPAYGIVKNVRGGMRLKGSDTDFAKLVGIEEIAKVVQSALVEKKSHLSIVK